MKNHLYLSSFVTPIVLLAISTIQTGCGQNPYVLGPAPTAPKNIPPGPDQPNGPPNGGPETFPGNPPGNPDNNPPGNPPTNPPGGPKNKPPKKPNPPSEPKPEPPKQTPPIPCPSPSVIPKENGKPDDHCLALPKLDGSIYEN